MGIIYNLNNDYNLEASKNPDRFHKIVDSSIYIDVSDGVTKL